MNLLVALVAALASTAIQPAQSAENGAIAPTHQVYVMRHLQKADGEDPPLSAEGAARAIRLADILAGSGIKAIFATPTRRARETAAPLAARLGIPIESYDPRNPAALVKAAAASPGDVLVVGHSNTVHDLVARFGGIAPAPLADGDYGTVWLIAPGGKGTRTLSLEPPAR